MNTIVMSSTYTTRSGRVSKPPERYEPVEEVTDDYTEGDYDEDEASEAEEYDDTESEDESLDDESDADENGNLEGFIDYEEDESDEEEA